MFFELFKGRLEVVVTNARAVVVLERDGTDDVMVGCKRFRPREERLPVERWFGDLPRFDARLQASCRGHWRRLGERGLEPVPVFHALDSRCVRMAAHHYCSGGREHLGSYLSLESCKCHFTDSDG